MFLGKGEQNKDRTDGDLLCQIIFPIWSLEAQHLAGTDWRNPTAEVWALLEVMGANVLCSILPTTPLILHIIDVGIPFLPSECISFQNNHEQQ